MKKFNLYIFLVFVPFIVFSQEKELGSEVVKVVKAYTPEVSDANKIKINPDEYKAEKANIELEYTTFSPKVASTYEPIKINSQGQDKLPNEKLLNNYLILGYGSYTTPLLDFYMNNKKMKKKRYGLNISHLSSQGGISGYRLNNSYLTSKIDGFYWQQYRKHQLKTNLYYQFNLNNYYGADTTLVNDQFVENVNIRNSYNVVGANLTYSNNTKFEKSTFQSSDFSAYYLFDRFSSSELRTKAKAQFNIGVQGERIGLDAGVDFISSNFNQSLVNSEVINNSYAIVNLSPNFEFVRDNIKFNLGLNLAYAASLGDGKNVFRIYPNIGASMNIIEDLMVVRAKFHGKMENNSYREVLEMNPFVSPTFSMSPHLSDFILNAAIEGRLTSTLHYILEGEYSTEKGFLNLVKNKSINTTSATFPTNPWEANNSFTAAMDTVNHFRFKGQVDYELIENLDLIGSITFHTYSSSYDKVYNRPNLEMNLNANYTLMEKFRFGAGLYFAGKRYYGEYIQTSTVDGLVGSTTTLGELDPYVDLNLDAEYLITKQLSVFARFNNIIGGNYELYKDFRVQGFQAMAGLTYKF